MHIMIHDACDIHSCSMFVPTFNEQFAHLSELWSICLVEAPPTSFSLADAIGISSAAFASVLVSVPALKKGSQEWIKTLKLIVAGWLDVGELNMCSPWTAHFAGSTGL